MARTRKILIGKEFTAQRTFGAFPNSLILREGSNYGWYQPANHQRFGATEDEERQIIAEAREAAKAYSGHSYSRPRVLDPAITNHFIRRGYSQGFAGELSRFLNSMGWSETDGEQRIISFQMMNEFLNQDTYEVYGDFLDEHWDTLYSKAVEFVFNEYAHTTALLREFYQSNLLTFRPRLPKVAQKEIEALTKNEIIKIRSLSVINESIPNGNARARLKSAVAVLNGEQSVSVPPSQIINTFARAFAKTIADVNPTTGLNILNVQKQFNEALSGGAYYLTAQRAESSSDKLFTNDIQRYANYLYEHAEEFTVAEMFFAAICWLETKLIARTGTKADVLGIFLQVMDTYKDEPDNILEFFRMVGEAGASYDGEVPTMTHWKKAFSEGYLDAIMGAEITLSLIAGSDKSVTKLERQRMYRNSLKGE